LNSYYGVEISSCTGNARRVPLKHIILMNSMQEMLEREFPGWTSSPWGREFISALRNDSNDAVFQFWRRYKSHRSAAGRIVFSVLDVLDHTGSEGGNLQAAVLHHNTESMINLKTRYNDWIELLGDSYLTATYAIVNDVCLEYRRPDHSISVCGDEKRYTVLQTVIGTPVGQALKTRLKIEPSGHKITAIDQDLSISRQPYLFAAEESPLRSLSQILQWQRRQMVRELVNQYPGNRERGHGVVLRAATQKYGGMERRRVRGVYTHNDNAHVDDISLGHNDNDLIDVIPLGNRNTDDPRFEEQSSTERWLRTIL
jgi:hypothetical protein